ncbi:sigma 54-interacting transcriptional regulator [Ideonella sp. B7]|uniref:sigma-54 interaction domain-containing protein n=1 Tax=Ideonella benzenivorans TaxID=2831643 RepID=UPI001CEC0822|nr:sigma 54-interacting transcriptional regulator [Ideonella benzenivorans]MCA6215163.1 sigma 54-interacting transcriptional regulator [Ideonella benzenivorans]
MSSDSLPVKPAVRHEVLPELVSFIEGLPEPHILFDRQYRIVAANAAYRAQFSPRGSVIGRTCYEVSHHFSVPCDQAGESCPLAQSRRSGQRERVLHLHHTPQGEAYVNIELVPLRDAQGQPVFYIEKMEPLPLARGMPARQGLIGTSSAFREMLALVARVAPSEASVLLLGESGTGKELVARAVHEGSPRGSKPWVVVDCASLTESLFESELFGHEKGAFTGAHMARAGLIEAASGGTLFLDEVGDIPLAMQVKLLRLLESGTYRRVGSTELRHADVRLVSATHRDLSALVAQGRFREDLYYRLSTFPIALPPLRERQGDIPLLATALLERVAPGRAMTLDRDAVQALARHPFPGNVRELRNVLERAVLLSDGDHITAATVARALSVGLLRRSAPQPPLPALSAPAPVGSGADRGRPPASLRAAEAQALRAALQAHPGSREALAATLGISVRTLYRKLKTLAPDGADPD